MDETINTINQNNLIPCNDGTFADSSIGCVNTPSVIVSSDTNITNVIINITGIILLIVIALSIILIIYGGIRYMLAKGNENEVENAKIIIWSIIALVIGLLSKAIVYFVLSEII